jgi:protein CpxP
MNLKRVVTFSLLPLSHNTEAHIYRRNIMNNAAKGYAVVAAVVAAVSFSPLNSSAFMGEDGSPPVGRNFKKMATELGLSVQQQQDIKAVFVKNRTQAEPLMQQFKTERRSLRMLIQAEAVDDVAIRAQSAKVAAIEADLAVQRAHAAQQVRSFLTPEQLQKFKELQARHDSMTDEKRPHRPKQLRQDN